jgi:hypothetical protein
MQFLYASREKLSLTQKLIIAETISKGLKTIMYFNNNHRNWFYVLVITVIRNRFL